MNKIIQVAIDSPAAAGAGTQAKMIANYFNLLYLDTGKIYRFIGYLKIQKKKKFNYSLVKNEIKKLKLKSLDNKVLISNKVALEAAIIAKDPKIRKIVFKFQKKCAYKPPKKFNGSVLDGRDITSVIVKDAMFKFFITANIKTRALRRYKELRSIKNKISYNEVLKSIKKRDKSDFNRRYSPLKKTKDSILINTTNLTKRSCFLKIKKIMEKKLRLNGNF